MKETILILLAIAFGFNTYAQEIKLSYKTESSDCYVKRIYNKNGKTYIDVDFIVLDWFLNRDGLDDYRIINNNPKIRTYRLTKSCYTTCMPDYKDCINDFKKEIRQYKKTIFSIKAVNGIVSSLYIPKCAG